MFGIVPGMKYGWPKNLLHWSGIHESILDICATVLIHFVIATVSPQRKATGPFKKRPPPHCRPPARGALDTPHGAPRAQLAALTTPSCSSRLNRSGLKG